MGRPGAPARRREPHVGRRRRERAKEAPAAGREFKLPTGRSEPVSDWWRYAFLVTGEKKIGKTSWAIQDCEEYVLQFDKPQLSYNIRETSVTSWKHFTRILNALEAAVEAGDFPYTRIVIDGVGEWYTMCQLAACKHFQVDHPSDVGYARCWHKIRDDFNDAVNRMLRLQVNAKCGMVFIAHSEWKEVATRGGGKAEKRVPNLPPKCEEVINGKVDGWFCYDYMGDDRVLIVLGDETTGAGHRIDGRFQTADGRRVREIHMGNSAEEAHANFLRAFNNEQDYATIKEMREGGTPSRGRRRRRAARGE